MQCWTLLLGLFVNVSTAEETNRERLDRLIVNYCADCHTGADAEASFDIGKLGFNLKDAATFERWQRVYGRIESLEMPPPDYEGLRPDDLDFLTQILNSSLERAHAETKGTVLRRLNRQEYENTLNDLFGTNLAIAELLPEDGRSHEFDNVGSALMMSSVQLGQYLETLQSVYDACIVRAIHPPAVKATKTGYDETREAEKFIGNVWKKLPDGSVAFFKSGGYPTGMLRTASAHQAGYYRVKISGYAYQSQRPITFAVGSTTFARGAEKPTYFYHSFEPLNSASGLQSVERTVWMDQRYMLEITPWGIADVNNDIKKSGLNAYQGPGLAIASVELEGPILDYPSRGHRFLFDGLERIEKTPANLSARSKSWYRPEFELSGSKKQFADALQRIARIAFRRSSNQVDITSFVALMDSQFEKGASREEAYLAAVSAIFTSPEFLFLQESAGRLNDEELATRLAYFLTRSTPTKSLRIAAAESRVASHDHLTDIAEAMVDEASFEQRFAVDFCDAWLNLRDIEFTSPDQNLFPEFDAFLQYSLLAETRAFVTKCIRENLQIENLVASDFAMLNNRLAGHYELPPVDGPAIRAVALPEGSVRGGLLSQGSILKVSANGTNTSPVVRGVWVLERILGQHAPPPPPGIPGVEPDVRGASTLREILGQHRSVDSCNACHKLIDPPGFALESFNPIGGWRERFRSLGEGERVDLQVRGRKVRYKLGLAVDASGTLHGGHDFDGFQDFRRQLAQEPEQLAINFVTKLLTFGTGREIGFSDREEIRAIVRSTAADGYRMRDLLLAAVDSEIFRLK